MTKPFYCTKNFDLVTFVPWPWLLTFRKKKLNLGYDFWIKKIRLSYYIMCIPCGKTFLFVPKVLTLWVWSWPCLLTYFWIKLTLDTTFEPKQIEHSYYTCIPHGKTFSGSTKIVHLMTLTVTFDLILRNWKCLITIISSQVYRSVGGLVLLEQPCSSCVFLVDQPFHLV